MFAKRNVSNQSWAPLLMVLLFGFSAAPLAGIAKMYNPFDEMTEGFVQVYIGGQTHPLDHETEPLFGPGLERHNAFKARLEDAVTARLQRSGIRKIADAPSGVSISMWGHAVAGSDCGLDWVFSLDFSAFGPEHLDDDHSGEAALISVKVGVAADDQLEDLLVQAALYWLDEKLSGRDAQRAKDTDTPSPDSGSDRD